MPGPPLPVGHPLSRRAAWYLAAAAFTLLGLYLLPALLLDARVGTVTLTWPWVGGMWVVTTTGMALWLRSASRVAAETLVNLALLAFSLFTALLIADVAASAYLGLTAPNTDLVTLARTDRTALVEEWYPRTYYPTAAHFRVHKPDFTVTGKHYGSYYLPGMLRSRRLADSVLDLREVTIHIDGLGFRDRSPIEDCPVYALGDSFTFGWGMTEEAAWPDLVERSLGQCVYNLGVNGASPWQELLLLEHLLSRGERPAPRRVLWVIYEGNDLDHPYPGEPIPYRSPGALTRATAGTVVEGARLLLHNLRIGSLIYRLRTGDIRLKPPPAAPADSSRYRVDGVRLATPMFHSPKLGYLLANEAILRDAAQGEPAVRRRYELAGLEHSFERMRELARSRGFAVTVVVFPASVRLYAADFDFTPAPSRRPYLVEHLIELSRKHGFEVVNLLERLAPAARHELLYFRDDGHLNGRGHEHVARVLDRAPPRPGHDTGAMTVPDRTVARPPGAGLRAGRGSGGA